MSDPGIHNTTRYLEYIADGGRRPMKLLNHGYSRTDLKYDLFNNIRYLWRKHTHEHYTIFRRIMGKNGRNVDQSIRNF